MPHRFKLPKIKKGMQSEQIAILYLIEKGFQKQIKEIYSSSLLNTYQPLLKNNEQVY